MGDSSPLAIPVDLAPAVRRSFTFPARLAENRGQRTASTVVAIGSEELLFSHDSAKIVSFDASTQSNPLSGGAARSGSDEDKAGVLSWTSTRERTIAAGPLRLYRLHSIAFLNSGGTLHAILPRSRCWCVDGHSKFVLRIRPNLYWRIEILAASEDKTEELKEVFTRILQYETTVCPFKRDFTVELPEPPKTPIRKRPWRAPERPKPPKLEGVLEQESPDEYTTAPSDNGSTGDTEEEDESDMADNKDATELAPRDFNPPLSRLSAEKLVPYSRPGKIPVPRSITVPPRLTLRTSNSTSSVYHSLGGEEDAARFSTLSSSEESFHSVQSLASPLPRPPPDSDPPYAVFSSVHHDEGIHICRYRDHKRDDSDATIIVSSSIASSPIVSTRSNDGGRSSPPLTPTLVSDYEDQKGEDWSEILTPPRDSGLRSRHARKRTLSPLPLAANLISPTAARNRLPSDLIQKACSLMLGPPVQLLSLMLRIAFKIANGALRGSASGYGESGEEIICQWDYNDGDDFLQQGAWEEDDFGIPLGGKEVVRVRRSSDSASWEVD
ncbi:hypothetical protein FGG08_003459 [Glutinoglossum americanum]|uniref:Inheritance of peroxisomes protein 1 n=1 Tax=Glutinoglossum americanum TaxID=1670608 RepID=A0A9P8L4Q0_9PEZI|nr:hypothetical protein FGG08_003459 [Glutinoglossum americanum]